MGLAMGRRGALIVPCSITFVDGKAGICCTHGIVNEGDGRFNENAEFCHNEKMHRVKKQGHHPSIYSSSLMPSKISISRRYVMKRRSSFKIRRSELSEISVIL